MRAGRKTDGAGLKWPRFFRWVKCSRKHLFSWTPRNKKIFGAIEKEERSALLRIFLWKITHPGDVRKGKVVYTVPVR